MNKVGIGALLENKLKKEKVDDMMDKLFLDWDYYSSNATEGIILVIWQKTFIKVQILMEHQQFVHCLVKLTDVQTIFLVTFVYGLNTMEERLELWKGLSFTPLPDKPWLIVGDFNAVFHFDDRAGGKTISDAEIYDSTAWIAQILMAGLKSIGSKCTWSNRQDGRDRVYSKIDHAFINENWVDALPNTIAEFQWDVNSDHCYCLIKTHKHGNLGTKPFKIFNLWIAHRGFNEVVRSIWNKPMAVRGLQGVIKKLLRLKHVLKAFNRDEIEDVEKGYHQAKGDYQLALNRAQEFPIDFLVQEPEKVAAARYQYHQAIDENRIVSFQNEQGVVIDDYNAVVHHFLDHFRGYMGSSSSAISTINSQCIDFGPCLDIEMQLKLIRKFRKSDVKKALFSIPGTKSPGPDCFGSEFYKAMWRNASSRCALKIDLSKAYDTVDWCFLEGLLVSLRFPTKFICWVMVCLRGNAYLLMMNGRLQGGFHGVKGLRQGDPISPLLFFLVMEYFTRLLQLGATQHDFKFHPLCKSLKIINLCFADDLIIFYKANKGSIQCVKHIFEAFCNSTGLKANHSKSHVYFGEVLNSDKISLLQILQFEEGTFPLKYLGVPMRPTKWKAADCEVI
ncbi:uncharacterized protein LOC133815080 [Humulus lupulus]|uniref:uncharacterized protein LOC133815080 n=1 Tax=Humulus lupulus TaxID=3486 RepID=UPI002B40422E|nr:uncharacterized protein LOC133815080 [Humulus lupulus]